MAITITDSALEQMLGDTTPYLLLNKRVHTFPDSITMNGNNLGNVVPLHGVDGSAFSSDLKQSFVEIHSAAYFCM